jgi:predicted MFS family arabinose efflux permease
LAIFAVVLWGIGSGGNWVLSSERIATLGPDHLMGRLTALDHIGMTAAMTLGTLAAALGGRL